jgi:hypothetical protein
MKKAKYILSATGILSVIAGAFAFKAQHKFAGKLYCTAVESSTSFFSTSRFTTGPGATTTLYCSFVATAPKPVTTRVFASF